ncbi:response regulator transcription factor [Pedobacter frigiditerrae]|uniref:Response regulator transcription factor n=1 Tax=Pedobacter frigiditerrae TaxID=2530452 RepID=A0A4R0N599_9SPHI|nr:LuxR C-terminal-related transcriptional regulator [Pedobacter frigiditerrae]TCC93424.1 response regulator transcription factor [Pedobacter frigiditerrae]
MTLDISYKEEQISQRELEILHLVCMGNNSKEISNQLFISELTVNTHRRNMVKRLGLKNSHQLVVWAFKERMFTI